MNLVPHGFIFTKNTYILLKYTSYDTTFCNETPYATTAVVLDLNKQLLNVRVPWMNNNKSLPFTNTLFTYLTVDWGSTYRPT